MIPLVKEKNHDGRGSEDGGLQQEKFEQEYEIGQRLGYASMCFAHHAFERKLLFHG